MDAQPEQATPVDAETRLTLLLGFPVRHSLSPLIHNAAFRAQKLNRLYLTASVRPPDLAAAVAGLKALGAAGANVTIPHKAAVLHLADHLSPQARAIGAVNTLVVQAREDGSKTLYGDNTDVAGFLQPLHAHAERLRRTSMLIFGAGGAARAVAYALLTTFQPERLTLAARTTAKAEVLARDLAHYDPAGALRVVKLEEAGPDVQASQLLVNATPLGTTPDVRATPWPHTADFSQDQVAYDLVYNPEKTRFLEEAAQSGAAVIGGMEMLIGQAAASYVQWTGQAMPVEAVRAALRRYRHTR